MLYLIIITDVQKYLITLTFNVLVWNTATVRESFKILLAGICFGIVGNPSTFRETTLFQQNNISTQTIGVNNVQNINNKQKIVLRMTRMKKTYTPYATILDCESVINSSTN